MYNYLRLNFENKISFLLFYSVIFFYLFKTYNGNVFYLSSLIWTHYLNEYQFIYLNIESLNLPGYKFLGSFFKILNININNDYIGFGIHFFFHTINFIFYYKILKKILVLNNQQIQILIISLITIGNIIATNRASIISGPTGHFTYFAFLLFPSFLYGIIFRNFFLLAFSSSLMIYIQPRVGLISFFMGSIFYIISSWKKKLDLVWVVPPLMIIYFFYIIPRTSTITEQDELLFLIKEFYFWKEENEVSFTNEKPPRIFLQIFSLAIYPFLVKKIKNYKFKLLFFTVYFLSLSIFLFDWIYTTFLLELIALPEIYFFSPPRSFFIFELFFFILIFNFILSLKLKEYIKSLIIGFLFFSKISLIGLIYSLIILVVTLTFFSIRKISENKKIIISFYIFVIPGIFFILSKYIYNFDHYSLLKLNKWTVNHADIENVDLNFSREKNREVFDFLLDLRRCKDFILLDPIRGRAINQIAYKSTLIPIINFSKSGFKKQDILDYKKKHIFSIKLKKNLDKNLFLDYSDTNLLVENNTRFIISKKKAYLLPKKYFVQNIGNYHSFFNFTESNHLNFCSLIKKNEI